MGAGGLHTHCRLSGVVQKWRFCRYTGEQKRPAYECGNSEKCNATLNHADLGCFRSPFTCEKNTVSNDLGCNEKTSLRYESRKAKRRSTYELDRTEQSSDSRSKPVRSDSNLDWNILQTVFGFKLLFVLLREHGPTALLLPVFLFQNGSIPSVSGKCLAFSRDLIRFFAVSLLCLKRKDSLPVSMMWQ